jgi:predicted DNA-binding transcriptional regulator YafY
LSALFNTRSETWFEVDFSRWETKTEDNEKFETLKTAVIHHKSAEISYASGDGQYSKRKVQPLKLYYKTNAWYLKAFCTERHDFRMFKLNRILSIKLLNEDFIPTSFPEVQKMPSQTYGKAVLRFSKEVAFRVYDEFSSSQVIRQDDGYLLVTAEMTREPWLISGLLSFGTQVEVIEPAYLKTQLAEKAKEIYEMNKA